VSYPLPVGSFERTVVNWLQRNNKLKFYGSDWVYFSEVRIRWKNGCLSEECQLLHRAASRTELADHASSLSLGCSSVASRWIPPSPYLFSQLIEQRERLMRTVKTICALGWSAIVTFLVVAPGVSQENMSNANVANALHRLRLTREVACNFARIALNCLSKEYPDKP
jgi:hypothetical protein